MSLIVLITDDTLQKKISCTACGKQVIQLQRNSVYEHPVLKVLICKVEASACVSDIFPAIAMMLHTDSFQSLILSHIFSSSPATSITQVMTSAETLMEWTSSAGKNKSNNVSVVGFNKLVRRLHNRSHLK